MPIRAVAFALALTGSQLCLAQTSPFEGKAVLEILYDPAEQPLAPEDLQLAQKLRTGLPYRAADVAETIDRLYATGRYEDIQVDVENRDSGVAVRFISRNARFVGHVDVKGKIGSPPGSAQILNTAELQLGSGFDSEAVQAAEKRIRKLLEGNGFYGAQVRSETTDDRAHQQVNIRIVVDSGKRARYEQPDIAGDTKLPDSTIIRATGWQVRFIGRWRQVTQALTQKGLTGIVHQYQKRDRLAASVNLTALVFDAETQRVRPALKIDAGPKIQVKAVEAKVSKGVLRRYIPVFEEGAVDRDLLVEGARNLRDYFQVKGYPDVDVTFRELPLEQDERTIEFVVSQGARQKLVRVEIQGNKYFDTDTLRERMILAPSSLRFRWGRFSEAFLKRDQEAIATLYRTNGFRDVHVDVAVMDNYEGKAGHIAAAFSIQEGPQWRVAHLELVGVDHLDRDALLAQLRSTDNQPYSDASVAADRGQLLTSYLEKGFRHATFEWSATPASEPNQVNLDYRVVEGEQEFVRNVITTGLHVTRPSLIERNLTLRAGDFLSLPVTRETERRLYDLGIFAKIDTAVQNDEGSETRKYVLYDFEEAHRYSLKVGVGAELARFGGTSTNLSAPSGATGFSGRLSVDVNRLNTLGLGHIVTLQTRLSNLEQKVALSYVDPKLFNVQDRTLTFSGLYDISRDVRTFSSRREEGSIQYSEKLSKPTTVFLRFAYRRVSTGDVVIPALLVPQLLQPVRIGILSGNWIQDRRDNPADAHKGMYNTVDVGLASGIFGSQRNFTRILARNATYHRLGKDVVLARQLTFGVILPFSVPAGLTSDEAVPLPERFFGGGSVSHRGFPANQAGPRDLGAPAGPGGVASQPTGFPLGGNALLFSNTELRFPLLGENIGGVLFHDAGNVYSKLGDISLRFHQNGLENFNYMVHAAGLGIRYKTPLGPVRADFAYSINPPRFVGFQGTLQDLLGCNPNLPPEQRPQACQSVTQGISHFQFFFSIGQTF